jgi:transcriptional regulator with XRE-family HTH domain
MKIEHAISDEAVLSEIGSRLATVRLSRNQTQAQLAAEAGISLRTLSRLESGEVATQLSGFVRVCRALDLLGGINNFVPEPAPSPLAMLKLHGRSRKRASTSGRAGRLTTKAWTWGDQS